MGAKAVTGTPMKEAIARERAKDYMARADVTSPFWLPPG
jgi:hypothetical protein